MIAKATVLLENRDVVNYTVGLTTKDGKYIEAIDIKDGFCYVTYTLQNVRVTQVCNLVIGYTEPTAVVDETITETPSVDKPKRKRRTKKEIEEARK